MAANFASTEASVGKRSCTCGYSQRKATSNMSIVDLNDDCLMEIFQYLNIKELVGVAMANSRFQHSTEKVFSIQHSGTPMIVSNHHDERFLTTETLHVEQSMDILEYFGHLISNLCIKFRLKEVKPLLDAICKFCIGNNIVQLEFWHLDDWNDWVDLCCSRNQDVPTFIGNRAADKLVGNRAVETFLRKLNRQFPKLIHLKMRYDADDNDCNYSHNIIQAMPSLTSFTAVGPVLHIDDIKKFVDSNGQLEELNLGKIKGMITQDFVDNLNASLPLLQTLELEGVPMIESMDNGVNPDRFQNLQQLTLGNGMVKRNFLTCYGQGIEELKLHIVGWISIFTFMGSITPLQKLKKLTFQFIGCPNRNTLDNGSENLSALAVRQLILQNNQLTKLIIIGGHAKYPPKNLVSIYHDVISEKLNEAQWSVQGTARLFSFTKDVEN